MDELTFPLHKYLNEKIFILIERDRRDAEVDSVEICKFDTFEELEYYVNATPVLESFTRHIYHGILTSAMALPATISRLITPLIISLENEVDGIESGIVLEPDTLNSNKSIAEDIELLMSGKLDIVGSVLTIDTTYIFYSYKIKATETMIVEDIDEDLLERCKSVADEVNSLIAYKGVS